MAPAARAPAALRGILLVLACGTEVSATTAPQLVDVTGLAPEVRLDMRYATADNFMGRAVYPCARCLLRADAATAFARAQEALAARGLRLVALDC